jgi:RNA polymerase sigma factor (sigma-70 family)
MEQKRVLFDTETQKQYLSGDSFLQDHVYKQCKNLIHSICLTYKRRFQSMVEYDELVSVGNEAFVKAAITYDPNKNVQFSTYLSKAVNKAILHYMRDSFGYYGGSLYRLQYFKTVKSLDQKIRVGDTEYLIGDLLPSQDDVLSLVEMSYVVESFLLHYIEKRDPKVKLMIQMIVSDKEYTQKEIADAIGTDQAHVSMMLKRMKQAFLKELERDQATSTTINLKIA